jgi:hypothetical protein
MINLMIVNENIVASSADRGSGIGTLYGLEQSAVSTINTLTILNGNITATNSTDGCGILPAIDAMNGRSSVITVLTIANGTITAIGGTGSGIRTLYAEEGSTIVDTITILCGNIYATSNKESVGIGAGGSYFGASALPGGTITANAVLAGIGSDWLSADVPVLRSSGTPVLAVNANTAKFPMNASRIILANGSLTFSMQQDQMFGGSATSQSAANLTVLYGNVPTSGKEPLRTLAGPFLHVLYFKTGHHYGFDSLTSTVKRIIVSVPSQANYSIRASVDTTSTFLEAFNDSSYFVVTSRHTYFDRAQIRRRTRTQTRTLTETKAATPARTSV